MMSLAELAHEADLRWSGPVVYRCYAADGELLYIGFSGRWLAGRLQYHRQRTPWFADVARVTVERHTSKRAARDREWVAILRERPKHNVMGQRGYDHGAHSRKVRA